MKIDLHAHSHYSHDAWTRPKSFVRSAKQKGLDAIAVTDHNTTAGWKAVSDEAKRQNVPLILGEEIKVYEKEKCIGEFIGLFLNQGIRKGPIEEVWDSLKAQDAIVIIPHPFDYRRHPFLCLEEFARKVDAIEVLNARCYSDVTNKKAKTFARKNELVGTAGSDAHTPWEIGTAYVEAKASNLEELRKAIRKGKIIPKGKRSNPLVHMFSGFAKIKNRFF